MSEIIKIKCPFDGAVLSVMNQPGLERKNVTCPICRNKYPFVKFIRIPNTPDFDEPPTDYSTGKEETLYDSSDNQSHNSSSDPNFTLGQLVVKGSNTKFQLRPGRNVIGRKAAKSSADFMIDTGADRAMSREHIVIDVRKVHGKGFVHYLSLFKEKVNETYCNGEQLLYGDSIIVNDSSRLQLPGVELLFIIPDEEGTEF